MQRKITLIVSAEGETEIKSQGFQGGECKQATRALETLLGETVSDVPTAEMYQEVVAPKISTSLG